MSPNWQELQTQAQLAEKFGFDAFAVPEITGDPFIHAALAANATNHIQTRTGIAVAFPRSPMVVANSAWAIHTQSGGRFALGLGTQVKGHNERRFSVRWKAPRARLLEYVQALRAIWRCWELGEPLKYEGEHYNFSLMTPEFSPAKSNLPMVPIHLAAVRPKMIESAASIADGIRLHAFCTKKYLNTVVMRAIERGLATAGRSRDQFEICGGGFIMTGPDAEAVNKMREWVRYRVAFYGSTRTYLPVMEAHGWNDLAAKLHHMSKTGQWRKMAAEVPDDVLEEFGVSATYDQLPQAIDARFGGVSDTIEFGFEEGTDLDFGREIVAQVHQIKSAFQGPGNHYSAE